VSVVLSWIVRLLMIAAGVVAEWFVSRDAPNFGVLQGAISLLLLVLIVFVLALWPRRWSQSIERFLRRGAADK
jgi:uncharacterized membrane protein YoaK (UPF0700 family)